jgi:hypothetical protein
MKNNVKFFNLIQLIERKKFDALVKKWSIDKGVRSFSTYQMTEDLINCALFKLDSYREVEAALGTPNSTFGDALRKRSHGFFEELCEIVLLEIRAQTQCRKTKRALREVLAIDSSECRVHGSLFSIPGWRQKTARSHLASAKLHTVWNIDGGWVEDFRITGNHSSDLTVGKSFIVAANKTYVFDRAYTDIGYWLDIVKNGSHFVTRLRKTPRNRYVYKYIGVNNDNRAGVLWDGEWTPSEGAAYKYGFKPKQIKFRYIIYRDASSGKIFDFITSDWDTSAEDIAGIYKKRWSVELLYRWLKSHLNIRYLSVKNVNAVKVQLAMAILVQLLLRLKKTLENYDGTLWELLRTMRTTILREILIYRGPQGFNSINPGLVKGLTGST